MYCRHVAMYTKDGLVGVATHKFTSTKMCFIKSGIALNKGIVTDTCALCTTTTVFPY